MKRFPIRAVAAVAFVLALAGVARAQSGDVPKGTVSLKGQFLVAAPAMRDPRFKESIIFMIDHDAAGAMGLIVNKTLGRGKLVDVLRGLGTPLADPGPEAEKPLRLGYGGPVEIQRGFFLLHSGEWSDAGTVRVGDGVFLSRQVGILRAMAQGQGPKQVLLVLGYSGWAANQLEAELGRDDWLTAPADLGLIFDDDQDGKWAKALRGAGLKL